MTSNVEGSWDQTSVETPKIGGHGAAFKSEPGRSQWQRAKGGRQQRQRPLYWLCSEHHAGSGAYWVRKDGMVHYSTLLGLRQRFVVMFLVR